MIGGVKGNFETPDENLEFEKISVQIDNLNGKNVKTVTLKPGCKLKEHMSQIEGTEFCEGRPFGVGVSGKYHAQHKDGTEFDILPGEAFIVEPGHNLWVVGDEPVVVYEFE